MSCSVEHTVILYLIIHTNTLQKICQNGQSYRRLQGKMIGTEGQEGHKGQEVVSKKQAELGCSVLIKDWVTVAFKKGTESVSLRMLARQLQTVSAEAAARYQSASLKGMSKNHKETKL